MLTYDPSAGFLLNGQRANLHGSVGRNVLDASTADPSALQASAYDPRYYEAYTDYNGDNGAVTRYRLKPEYADRLGGRTQLQSHSVGGYGEAIDPSQVEWDDEFGLLTSRTNIKDPATPRDNMLGNIAMAAMALPIGYGIALDAGLLGAAGGSSGFPAGAGIAGPSLETAGIATGIEGLGATPGLFPPGAGPGVGGPLLETAGMSSNVPWYTQALANAGANLTNPMTIARALMGASQLASSFGNRNGGSGSNNVSTSGEINPLLNLPAFNPLGLLANYKPREIKPVPFMTGTGLL